MKKNSLFQNKEGHLKITPIRYKIIKGLSSER